MSTLHVYIAGAYADRDRVLHNMEKVSYREELQLVHDWVSVIDRVRREHPDWQMPDHEAAEYALRDLEAMRKADVVWLLAPELGGRGCWYEVGAAWAWRIPTIVSGPFCRSTVFTRLALELFDADVQAFARLEAMAEGTAP